MQTAHCGNRRGCIKRKLPSWDGMMLGYQRRAGGGSHDHRRSRTLREQRFPGIQAVPWCLVRGAIVLEALDKADGHAVDPQLNLVAQHHPPRTREFASNANARDRRA